MFRNLCCTVIRPAITIFTNKRTFCTSQQNNSIISQFIDPDIVLCLGSGGCAMSAVGIGRWGYEKLTVPSTMGKLRADLFLHLAENLLPLPEIAKTARVIQCMKWLGIGSTALFIYFDNTECCIDIFRSSLLFSGVSAIQIFARYTSHNRGFVGPIIVDKRIPILLYDKYPKYIEYIQCEADLLEEIESLEEERINTMNASDKYSLEEYAKILKNITTKIDVLTSKLNNRRYERHRYIRDNE